MFDRQSTRVLHFGSAVCIWRELNIFAIASVMRCRRWAPVFAELGLRDAAADDRALIARRGEIDDQRAPY
jgi:hypothetical protein